MRERHLYNPAERCHDRFTCSSGSRFRDKIACVRDERGLKVLKKVGEVDVQEMINSHREACDLQKILERCMANGTADQLAFVQRGITDYTGLPSDPRKVQDLLRDCRFVYEGLSVQQKIHYPTFDDFLEAFSTQQNISQFVQDSQIVTPAAAAIEPAAEEGVSA